MTLVEQAPVSSRPSKAEPRPTPAQVQATWATILLSLAAFWYGVGVAAHALWGSLGG